MKNFFNKITKKILGRSNFGTKFERFTIINPITNCFNFAYSKKTYKVAFTLAEVLITIAIIGVVAVLVLPSLNKKIQEFSLYTLLKKQTTLINNTLYYIQKEHELSQCYLGVKKCEEDGESVCFYFSRSECPAIKSYLIEYLHLNTISIDKKWRKVYNYPNPAYKLHTGGWYETPFAGENYVLKDGAIISFKYLPHILFDINGLKGPNKWGHDVFWFHLSNHNKEYRLFITSELISIKDVTGKYPIEILEGKSWGNNAWYELWRSKVKKVGW